ncbi:hypothetical protein [Chromobacterium piscinae]|uniref:hypothetical protein n=1 Tax=Chromobacterium piscinae TaxID=686831 RepID=UPI0032086DC2
MKTLISNLIAKLHVIDPTYWIMKTSPFKRLSNLISFIKEDHGDELNTADQLENEGCTLPKNECIELASIWVIELYTPSQISRLLDGLKNLGWETNRSESFNISQWLKNARQNHHSGSANLGLVTPTPKITSEHSNKLPYGVHAAFPRLILVTPSITALSIVFYLDSDAAKALDAPMKKYYKTKYKLNNSSTWWRLAAHVIFNKRINLSKTILDPVSQKQHAVRDEVSRIERGCTEWVRKNLPGIFSADLKKGKTIPTAALLISEEADPSKDSLRSMAALNGLAISSDWDAWVSDSIPTTRLSFPYSSNYDEARLMLACRRRDALINEQYIHDPTSNWSISYKIDQVMYELFLRWAVLKLIGKFDQQLSELRDQSANTNSSHPIRDLKHLRNLVRTNLYDMELSAYEINKFANSSWYAHGMPNMRQMESPLNSKIELIKSLRQNKIDQAQKIQKESELIKSVLSMSNDISQTITNLKIQRFMVILTFISIGVSIAALYVSVHAQPNAPTHFEHISSPSPLSGGTKNGTK